MDPNTFEHMKSWADVLDSAKQQLTEYHLEEQTFRTDLDMCGAQCFTETFGSFYLLYIFINALR